MASFIILKIDSRNVINNSYPIYPLLIATLWGIKILDEVLRGMRFITGNYREIIVSGKKKSYWRNSLMQLAILRCGRALLKILGILTARLSCTPSRDYSLRGIGNLPVFRHMTTARGIRRLRMFTALSSLLHRVITRMYGDQGAIVCRCKCIVSCSAMETTMQMRCNSCNFVRFCEQINE